MHTFRVLDQQIGLVPAAIARTLGAVDTARGREEAFRLQRPQILEALVDVARIQSTEASNAIEQVVAPRKRIEALVAEKTTPRNRSEAEIAGYRAVLDLIHDSALQIPFRPPVVEQLHRNLYQWLDVLRAGRSEPSAPPSRVRGTFGPCVVTSARPSGSAASPAFARTSAVRSTPSRAASSG